MEEFQNTGEPFVFKKTRNLLTWFLDAYGRFYLEKKVIIIDNCIYCSNKRKKNHIKWRINDFVEFQKKIHKEQGDDVALSFRPHSVNYEADYIEQGGKCLKNHLKPNRTFYDNLIKWIHGIFSFSLKDNNINE